MTEPESSELLALLSLKLIPDLGNRSILRLLETFGSARSVFRATSAQLSTIRGLRESARSALISGQTIRDPEAEWNSLQREGVRLVCLSSPGYPANLAGIPDPPAILFVRGALEPRDVVSIAVVGSRAASPTGVAFAGRLCSELSQYGITVVSGLAVGIDAAAHSGALRGRGRTVAVLGCGPDVDYPRGSGKLRDEICESGAVVTEFPLGTPPSAGHFPMRNRIISGLSLGVVVVEAAQRSGALITARYALEQGREVFAVPGVAGSFRSTGTHLLLREGAKLVERAEDIIEEIRPQLGLRSSSGEIASRDKNRPDLTREESDLLKVLDARPAHIDEICTSVDWPASRVMSTLLSLELKELVRQLPGKLFSIIF